MCNFVKPFLPFSLLVVLANLLPAAAVYAASANLTVTAESLASAITLEEVQPLSFGGFVPGDNGGTLILAPDGNLSVGVGDVLPNGGESAGSMLITKGVANQELRVSFTSSEIELTAPDAGPFGQSMRAYNFVVGDDGSGAVFKPAFAQIRLDENGEASFNVGASLDVNPNQPAGVYTGQVEVQLIF